MGKSSRLAFGEAIADLGAVNNNVVVLINAFIIQCRFSAEK